MSSRGRARRADGSQTPRTVESRLRQALGCLWRSFWKHAPTPVKADHEEGRYPAEARARFWSEFREGQREAEARSSRPR